MNSIYWSTCADGSNQLWTLLATDKGVCRLLYPHDDIGTVDGWLRLYVKDYQLVQNESVFADFGVLDVLGRYFAGEKGISFDTVPLELWGTEFQRKVWLTLGAIPYGETRTYGQIADAAGHPKAVRAIGAANGRNPVPVLLPCHRVVGANGTLTGYRGGLSIKERLLTLEGVSGLEAKGHERFLF